jgi:hypothetical protein
MVRGFLRAAALTAVSITPVLAQAKMPAQVHIVGSDYAFLQPPTSLAAGETVFSFENRGKVRHEVNIQLLKGGVTPEQAMRAVNDLEARRKLIERNVGILIAQPGDSAGGRILANLIPGRSYALVCVLRDTPDSQMHVMLGMMGGFTVPTK